MNTYTQHKISKMKAFDHDCNWYDHEKRFSIEFQALIKFAFWKIHSSDNSFLKYPFAHEMK